MVRWSLLEKCRAARVRLPHRKQLDDTEGAHEHANSRKHIGVMSGTVARAFS